MSERDIADRQALQSVSAHRGAAAPANVASRAAGDGIACRLGDASCAAAHAASVGRLANGQRSSVHRSLLWLQRRYGNRYVGQVLRQAGAVGSDGGGVDAIERSIDRASGGGQGTDHSTRTRMESAFGADFSGVRIHTDARADGLSQSLRARALTTGRDVFFRQGEYSLGASSGRELLAHELTHVVQQNGDGIQRKMTVSEPGDAHEIEADQMARAIMRQWQGPASDADRQVVSRQAATRLDEATAQWQPEVVKSEDEEKKKQLQTKADHPTIARQAKATAIQPGSGLKSTTQDQSGQIYGIWKNEEYPNHIKDSSMAKNKCLYIGKTARGQDLGGRFIEHLKGDSLAPWWIGIPLNYGDDDDKWPYVVRNLWIFNGITTFDVAVAEQYYIQSYRGTGKPPHNSVNAITLAKFLAYKDVPGVWTTKLSYQGGWKPERV
jgi:hypothetical protein